MVSRERWPFHVVALALFLLLAGANLPTPLYAVYREHFGFSTVTLTLVFAAYAVALIPSLLLFGQLSDRLGRRKVLVLGLFAAAVAMALFAAAQSTEWLYAARIVQGIALGATSGTAAAALVELEPDGDAARAAAAAVIAQAGGAATGPVVAGVLAQWAPEPLVLPYLLSIAAFAIAAVSVLRIPEPSTPTGNWRLQRPRVPAAIRAGFIAAALTAAAVWAVGGMYLSVVPTYAGRLLKSADLALHGAIAGLVLAFACAAQAYCIRVRPPLRAVQAVSLASLTAGLAALLIASPLRSLALLVVSAALSGAGLGGGSFGSQTLVNRIAPADHRGEVTAAYVVCIYCGVATAAISVGVLSEAVSLYTAVLLVASAIAVVALAAVVRLVTLDDSQV